MAVDKEAWLKLTMEDVIDPELPICDPHQHLWDAPGNEYMLDKFLADVGVGHNVVKTIYVSCDMRFRKEGPEVLRSIGEVEYVKGLAGKYSVYNRTIEVAAGMVLYIDLKRGDAVKPVIDAHLEVGGKMVCGVRCGCMSDPDPRLKALSPPHIMLDRKFREGMACLKKYNLPFDAWLYFHQLPELTDLARAFPDITIVCDHIGGVIGVLSYANRREEMFQVWKKHMEELATCPNVYVKLGGQGNPRCGWGFEKREVPPGSEELAKAWAPYFNWCIEKFGPQRCMFESNFPPDRQSCSHIVIWNAFKRIAAGYSPDEKKSLFYGTAVKAFGLRP